MRRSLVLLLFLGLPAAHAKDDRPNREAPAALQKKINKAIDNGVAYLKKRQRKDGSWPYRRGAQNEHATGGLTALALYALAASRVPATDRSIKRGLGWAKKHRTPFSENGQYATYSVALLVLALTRIDAKEHEEWIHRLAGHLVRGHLSNDSWSYGLRSYSGARTARPSRIRMGDNSNSQFAVLALWAAHVLAGFDVPRRTWERIAKLYIGTQLPGGGWTYSPSIGARGVRRARPSMTSAGLCSFVYATAALDGGLAGLPKARDETVAKRGERALLDARPRFNFANYYFDYSLERAGTVMAIPEDLWYFDGARALVKLQRKDGSWRESMNRHGDGEGVYETALALLFLSRATRYAITPGGDPDGRRPAVTKTGDAFPNPARELERAFDFYVALKVEDRASLRERFSLAGPAAVELFIRRLSHESLAVRRAAWELLFKLVDKRFFFEPEWPAYERAEMLAPITEWFKSSGDGVRWDPVRKVFAVR